MLFDLLFGLFQTVLHLGSQGFPCMISSEVSQVSCDTSEQ